MLKFFANIEKKNAEKERKIAHENRENRESILHERDAQSAAAFIIDLRPTFISSATPNSNSLYELFFHLLQFDFFSQKIFQRENFYAHKYKIKFFEIVLV